MGALKVLPFVHSKYSGGFFARLSSSCVTDANQTPNQSALLSYLRHEWALRLSAAESASSPSIATTWCRRGLTMPANFCFFFKLKTAFWPSGLEPGTLFGRKRIRPLG